MQLNQLLENVIEKNNLSEEQMQWAMQQIMQGHCNEIEMAAFLIALRCKGESVIELTAAVQVMRSLATAIKIDKAPLIDIVGTGGDNQQTFNISTASCFIVAAAGGVIAKHGNRSASSKSGAADVLEAAGANLQMPFETIVEMIEQLGVGFLFAPQHHSAMKNVIPVRKALGVRTIFNLLGPLTNPAGATHHLIGVYDRKWLIPFAEVLKKLGSKKALIVHGADGLDEITLADKTHVSELSEGKIISYEISPEQFGIQSTNLQSIRVSNALESLQMIKSVFSAQPGPAFDIVCLNAGAALYAADISNTIADGIALSQKLLRDGKVKEAFEKFINFNSTK